MAGEDRFMRRAAELAERGRGAVGTNPLVGAVVVRGGRVVGEGWHARYGGPHAEPVALAAAGDRSRGATLHVTLEPCDHLGKTPPCTRAILAAGIRRVVIGLPDPTQRGRGAAALRRQGVRVSFAREAAALKAQNREWLIRLGTRRPFLALKLATTLDGRIADFRGRSKWISSAASRRWTRSLRNEADAVMVGAGTALADDPRLTAPVRDRNPLKVVVDGRCRLSPAARMFRGGGRVWIATTAAAPASRMTALRLAGAAVRVLPSRSGRVDLRALLRQLYAEGVGAILCEGGAELAGALVAGGLVDRLLMVLAPKLLGGRRALPAVTGPDRPLGAVGVLRELTVRRFGPDVVLDGRP